MCIHLYLDVVRQTYTHADRQLVYIDRRQVEIQIEKLKEKSAKEVNGPPIDSLQNIILSIM